MFVTPGWMEMLIVGLVGLFLLGVPIVVVIIVLVANRSKTAATPCPKCGKPTPQLNFCPHCGASLSDG